MVLREGVWERWLVRRVGMVEVLAGRRGMGRGHQGTWARRACPGVSRRVLAVVGGVELAVVDGEGFDSDVQIRVVTRRVTQLHIGTQPEAGVTFK